MKRILLFALLAASLFSMEAQDFGFGDDAELFSAQASASPFKISGDVSAEVKVFFDDLETAEKLKGMEIGNIFQGNLDFSVSTAYADAFINLKLVPVFDGSASPVNLGEAYGRAYFGPVALEAGLRKLFWGKADSFGPLDVVNPLDYSDLSQISDPKSIKIPRPMVHATMNMGSFSKLELVFVPWFQGHTFALSGRWAPAQISAIERELLPALTGRLQAGLTGHPYYSYVNPSDLPLDQAKLDAWLEAQDINDLYMDYNNTLRSAQAGLRFTTTLGASDLGFQYYFGRLPRPAFSVGIDKFVHSIETQAFLDPLNPPHIDTSLIEISMGYNYYHQVGVDFAQVIAGFNTRAELGANITNDPDGTDGAVYNPALVYSLGFDRDLFLGINLNLQGNGSVRLFHDRIKENLFDIEADKKLTSTRITGILSRNFLRDELELKISCLWGIEDKDFLVLPAVVWSKNDVSAELGAGFFGGDKKGELGQYWNNNYLRTLLTFRF